MEPFVKLDLDCDFVKGAKKGAPSVVYGSIRYYRVLGNPLPFHLLKLWRPDFIRWVEVDAPAQPHRDHSVSAAINFYFDPADATTTFWTEGPDAKALRYPGASKSNIYEEEGLIRGPSFTAQPGDTYLLNNSEIHSVAMTPGKLRRFVQLSWTQQSFSSVLQVVTAKN